MSPVTPAKPKALELMASRLSIEPAKLLDCLKATVFQKASNEELMALVMVSNEYGLNPLLKEIYAFPAKGGGIVPVVSVDGWNKMVIRNPDFDGIEFEFENDEQGAPYSCTATIYIKGRTRPVKVTEYFAECKRNTDPWNNMPRRMLRHKALIQCSRVAFGFSGVSDPEEAIDISASVVVESGRTEKKISSDSPRDQEKKSESPLSELNSFLILNDFTPSQFLDLIRSEQMVSDADSIGEISEIKTEDITRLLRAKPGLIAGLTAIKGGAK